MALVESGSIRIIIMNTYHILLHEVPLAPIERGRLHRTLLPSGVPLVPLGVSPPQRSKARYNRPRPAGASGASCDISIIFLDGTAPIRTISGVTSSSSPLRRATSPNRCEQCSEILSTPVRGP